MTCPLLWVFLLNHKNAVKGIKKVIADVAKYMSENPGRPQLVQAHADGAFVLEVGQDFALAPDQMNMFEGQSNRFVKTAWTALRDVRGQEGVEAVEQIDPALFLVATSVQGLCECVWQKWLSSEPFEPRLRRRAPSDRD